MGQFVEDISGHLEHPEVFLTLDIVINPDKLTQNEKQKSCAACRLFPPTDRKKKEAHFDFLDFSVA